MTPFWVETGTRLRLAIVPRPRGNDWLETEMLTLKKAGVDILVSMLTAEEAAELGLSTEEAACHAAGIVYECFPVQDREVPLSATQFSKFIERLRDQLRADRSVAVHCRASIGRSSLLIAGLLCAEGFSPQDAFKRVSKARGLKVPDTPEQVAWVERFASGL